MILSSTVGIYRTDPKKPDITRLFGVAGVDLPMWKLTRHFKSINVAPNSRQFILNKSGFVIIHPFLQETIDGVTVRRSYRSMSLHQLEYISDPNWVQDFRLIMHKLMGNEKNSLVIKDVPVKMPIDCVANPRCNRIDPECSYDHCQRFLFSQTTFQFQKISGDFVVGQAIPNEHANTNIGFSEKFRSDKTSFVGGSICNSNYRTRTPRQDYLCELLREMRNNYQIALPDQWKYCVKKKTANRRDDCNDFTQKEALIEYLTERNPRFECEESYIDALLYDVKITSSLINIWSDVFRDENDNARTMINFGFCLTRSGLLRFLDNSPQGQQKSISVLNDYGLFSKSGYPVYYKKAIGYPSKTYIFTMSASRDSFLMTRAYFVGENSEIQENEYAPMMISGFQLKNKYLLGMIREKINDRRVFDAVGGSPCGDWNKPNTSCSGGYRCFVIDDFGYVYLSSRATDEVGKHLGTVDPTLFETMVTDLASDGRQLFKKFTFRNFQSTSRQNQTNSPILLDLEDSVNTDFHIDRSCVKDYTIYQFNRRSKTSTDYTTVCPGGSKLPGDPIEQCYERKFALRPIFSTNLLMLWVQCCDTGDESLDGPNNGVRNNCIEPRNFTETLKAQEVAGTEKEFCEVARDQAEDLQSTEMIDNIERVESVSFAKQLGCSGCVFRVINLSLFFPLLLHCLN